MGDRVTKEKIPYIQVLRVDFNKLWVSDVQEGSNFLIQN